MIHQETKTETKEVVTVIREWVTCDLCSAEIREGPYEVREGEISLTLGSSYPEGREATETCMEICEQCFNERLLPWWRAQGGKVTVRPSRW